MISTRNFRTLTVAMSMNIVLGARVQVLWTDGRVYTATVTGFQNGHYAVRFDGAAEQQWVPVQNVRMDGPMQAENVAVAATGAPVYDEGSEVRARRSNGIITACMIIEFDPQRRMYQVIWDGDQAVEFIDPSMIDPSSYHGIYGEDEQAEMNNPTFAVGTHVGVQLHTGQQRMGTIIAFHRGKFLCRWHDERARAYISREQIIRNDGVRGDVVTSVSLGGQVGRFLDAMVEVRRLDPRYPPTDMEEDWYRDGSNVWAQASEDRWWYPAEIVKRAWVEVGGGSPKASRYTVRWSDGTGESTMFSAQIRSRGGF